MCKIILQLYLELSKLEISKLIGMEMDRREQDLAFFEEGASRAAALLRAVGNESRLLVLCLLIEHKEMSVGALLQYVKLSQSALSQHLARMREEGLIAHRRESQMLYYRITDPAVEKLIATLKSIYCP